VEEVETIAHLATDEQIRQILFAVFDDGSKSIERAQRCS